MENQSKNQTGRAVYVVDGSRTPFLKYKGVPGPFAAADLAVSAAKPLLAKMPFAANAFDEVIVGCVMPSEEEANIARIIALRLGCGQSMPAFTVQRNCASGLQAIDSARIRIARGDADLILAGGTEAMSRAPLLFPPAMVTWLGVLQKAKAFPAKAKAIAQFRPQFLKPVIAILKGLTDPIVNLNMGQTAEELAFRFGISREEMDAYSARSHEKALAAFEAGELDEINPIYSHKGEVFDRDDGVRKDSTPEKLAKLRPVFEKFGSITAGNSSQISDGAAFVVLASADAVHKYKLPVLGKIVDVHWAALDPAIMGLGPVHAITPILLRQNLTFNELDILEINEAFAAQVLACQKAWESEDYCKSELNLSQPLGSCPLEKLNPQGGAISIGHPVGASGARIVLHILKHLNQTQATRGVGSLCIGGGQGGAILLERITEV